MRLVDWNAADGTQIVARLWGDAEAQERIVCLPGLTRNSRDFDRIGPHLAGDPARQRAVLAVDFRGRGLSGRPGAATYRPEIEAADVVAGLDRLGWTTPAYIGTSRGGIVTMVLAATVPDRVGRVVLNDIGPVLATRGLAAIRARLAANTGVGWADWPAAIAALGRAFLPAFTRLDEADLARIAGRLCREIDGRVMLDYDTGLYEAFAGFDPKVGIPPFWPLFEALGSRPVLVIRGANSDLLEEETVREMAARHPGMHIHHVPHEGHAPLLDDVPTQERIGVFLEGLG